MRNLTIKREKSFNGCLVNMNVYIEDPYSDVMLCGIPCRLLGSLKNGQDVTFSIGEEALKVFVIPQNMNPKRVKVSLEYYSVPAGWDDVFVSGALVSSPFSGVSFCYNVSGNEEGLKAVKRKSRNGILVTYLTVFCVMIGIIAVIGLKAYLSQTRPKDFTIDKMTITLTNKFWKYTGNDFLGFDSEDVAVFVVNDGNLDEYEITTVDEYCRLLMLLDYNDVPSAKMQTSDGLTYIEYTYTDTDEETGKSYTYRYFDYAYHSGDEFWLITFALYDKDTTKYQSQITEWAKSVRFAD